MKYLPFGLIIVLAVVVGFFLGRYATSINLEDNALSDRTIIRDTIIKEKTIQIIQPKENSEVINEIELTDSTDFESDSVSILIDETDSTNNDLSISREKLLKKASYSVSYLNTEKEIIDSTLNESLGIKPTKIKAISVEFWESPLNFEGYKLSKSKLVLYGVTTQFDFEFVKNGKKSFLASDEISYELMETDKFQPLKIVPNSVVYAD